MPHRPPRFACIAALIALAALAGCGRRDNDNVATDTASISFTGTDDTGNGGGDGGNQSVSVSGPGFSAKLSVPGLSLGAHDTDIGGIRMHPGSRITGMNVNGQAGDGTGGEGRGTVQMRFADPAAPDAVLAYYRDAARGSGWTETPPAAGEQFAATKPGKGGTERLGLSIAAGGVGSTGQFVVTGS